MNFSEKTLVRIIALGLAVWNRNNTNPAATVGVADKFEGYITNGQPKKEAK